nr:hypothetical protein [Paenibacillus peoriae]
MIQRAELLVDPADTVISHWSEIAILCKLAVATQPIYEEWYRGDIKVLVS